MARGVEYDDETKTRALEIAGAKDGGLAKAAKETGVAKTTIATWAKNANIEVATPEQTASTEKATTTSKANRAQAFAEFQERIAGKLMKLSELGVDLQLELLADPLAKYSLYELMSATTRAIHDLQLTVGKPTEITEDVTIENLLQMQMELQAEIERGNDDE